MPAMRWWPSAVWATIATLTLVPSTFTTAWTCPSDGGLSIAVTLKVHFLGPKAWRWRREHRIRA